MNRFIAILSSALILCGMISFIIIPKSDFSENENRVLQKFPQLSVDNVLEGKFMTDLSTYLSDHFPVRDNFVELKTGFEKNILNKKFINNIYICDNALIENYNKPVNTDRIINTFNKFTSNTHIRPDLMLVPTAITVYSDKLPDYAKPYSQMETIQTIYDGTDTNNINVYDTLMEQKDNEQLFYRLDHHWTTDGAYIAYTVYCNEKGITPLDKSEFNIKTVSEDFKGTVYSKLNDNSVESDSIKVYDRNIDLDVIYDNNKSDSLYSEKYIDTKDKYSYFLDNIHSYIEITNNDIDTDKELIVAKDSYANCLVPFLVNHYKKVYVFDPRSYKGSISEFSKEHKNVSDILILYNINTIDNDTGVNVIY